MLGKIEFLSLSFLAGFIACAACLGAIWLARNGYGKLLAIYHAKAAEAKAQADQIYSQISSQVETAVGAKLAELPKLVSDAVAAKLGNIPTLIENIGPRITALEAQAKAAATAAVDTIKPAA